MVGTIASSGDSPCAPLHPVVSGLRLSLLCSYLADTPADLVAPLLAFNSAVWRYREPAQAASVVRSSEWLTRRIAELAHHLLRSIKAPKKKRKKTFDGDAVAEEHYATLTGLAPGTAICYTDGSASPNPGPSGAGATIFIQTPGSILDLGASLGPGTNNTAELYALGMLLTYLRCLPSLYPGITSATIFSDSRIALHATTSKRPPLSNAAITLALRKTYAATCLQIQVNLHWVRGHASVGGNERVDRISKRYASTINNSDALPFNPSFPSHFSHTSCPPPFPLRSLPPHFFLNNLPQPPSSLPTANQPTSKKKGPAKTAIAPRCPMTLRTRNPRTILQPLTPVPHDELDGLDWKHCDD
jgi:ribonuclease HI